MKKVEEKLLNVIDFIKNYIEIKGFPPSYREISRATGIKSTNSVKKYMDILEERQVIKKDTNKNRCISLINEESENDCLSAKIINIPVVGKITAGIPILAEQNISNNLQISRNFFNTNNELFMLDVIGDSMIDANIFDGDCIVLKKQNVAENGDIVAAMIDGSATVKTFYLEKDRVRLQPQNKNYSPIYCDKQVVILGIVVGLIRKF